MVKDRRFRQLDVVVDDAYKMEMNKPVHVGFFILQYGKMHMLHFYYDFINMYLERPLLQYCEIDTDSAYLTLAGESVDDIATLELREHYFWHCSEWLPSESCAEHQNVYVRCRLTGRPWAGAEQCCTIREHRFCSRWNGLLMGSWGCAVRRTIVLEPPKKQHQRTE